MVHHGGVDVGVVVHHGGVDVDVVVHHGGSFLLMGSTAHPNTKVLNCRGTQKYQVISVRTVKTILVI